MGNQAYNSIAANSQCVFSTIKRSPFMQYVRYGRYLVIAQSPKLSYVNNFEPEYTKKTVKYNAPIVLSMFAGTLLLSEIVRRNKL